MDGTPLVNYSIGRYGLKIESDVFVKQIVGMQIRQQVRREGLAGETDKAMQSRSTAGN